MPRFIECEQGTEEWWEAHRGVPSASRFGEILTPKTGKLSASHVGLICELIAQKCTLCSIKPENGFVSRAMEAGTLAEPEARRWLEMERGVDIRQVGVVVTDDGRFCCSPDGLVGEDEGIEIKCPLMKTHVGYLLNGGLPDDYKAQVHGSLIVAGRKAWTFLSYCPGLPPLLVRVTPDKYTEQLAKALEEFWLLYQAALTKLGIDTEAPLP